MNYSECLRKFVNTHTDNFLQSFYAVVESSQIHDIRTLLLTCLSGSVGNLLHDAEIEKIENCFYIENNNNNNSINKIMVEKKSHITDNDNICDDKKVKFNKKTEFLNKCKKVYNLRKSLQNAQIKTSGSNKMKKNILDYYI
ncbi:conserved protein, unknown function [Hepatocystis sp. ex Piliocolobus tephrosceles]|nr:conserved protein, unknown function [Hepatocystis sp. ex Piliocolobus tephrosceles]